jgi:DNA repair exonuclease SbcCD nuclease subunit
LKFALEKIPNNKMSEQLTPPEPSTTFSRNVEDSFESRNSETKVLFVGDPHFKIKNVEYIPLFTSKVTTIAESNNIDFVVIAGDLLDNHDKLDVEPFNLALNFINLLSQKNKVFVLVGNHDYKNNQQFLSNHHWMNALKKWNNVTIVDDIVEHEVKQSKFLFVPYVPPGRFIEAVETKMLLKDVVNSIKSIFAHQEFYGCKMGPIESKQGDKWDEKWPMVVSGHIHDKQWSQQNIYYPGSAMQHAFGQSSENTISLITFSDQSMNYEEIDLEMPKLTIKYLTTSEIMKPLKFKNKEFRKYKIVLQGTHEEFKNFKKNSRYKQLLDEGFKITFKIKNLKLNQQSYIEPTKKFIDILQEKIKNENDPHLEQILNSFI